MVMYWIVKVLNMNFIWRKGYNMYLIKLRYFKMRVFWSYSELFERCKEVDLKIKVEVEL